MSSVISASRRWEGRMSVSDVASVSVGVGVVVDGLTSRRMDIGDMDVSIGIDCIGEAFCWFGGGMGALGHRYVARDMSSTIRGRMCFPSAWV